MAPPTERLVKPKTAKAQRALLKRAPRLVETLKKALLLQGNKTSQVSKARALQQRVLSFIVFIINNFFLQQYALIFCCQEALRDLSILRKGECVKLTRKNDNARPFDSGGEVSLEFFARKADCSQFVLASHNKKRRPPSPTPAPPAARPAAARQR